MWWRLRLLRKAIFLLAASTHALTLGQPTAHRIDPLRPSVRAEGGVGPGLLTETEVAEVESTISFDGREVPLSSRMMDTAPVAPGLDMGMYPACPPASPTTTTTDDLEHFLQALRRAHFVSSPFPFVYFCDMFPTSLYADLVRYFPPVTVMEPAVKRSSDQMKKSKGYSAAGSNNHADRRWKMSAYDILAMKPSAKWPELARAKPTWERLRGVLFHPSVQGLLWERFNLTRKPVFHDFRVQSDHTGYSIGVHPDSPKKILTMMFYVPLSDATVYDFGTCLHSVGQYQARNLKKNGEAPCLKKFKFGSNTGYSFVVNDISYHSVNTVGRDKGERRQTILVNWYDTIPSNSRPKSFRGRG